MARANGGRPESLVSFLEKTIESDVSKGVYEPGARLSPSALAVNYGVSHIPVREALSSLAAKGFVEHRQSKGYFARTLSSKELGEIYHWRTVLETEALRMAFPRITKGDIAEMRELVAAEEKLLDTEDRSEYLVLNRRFHFVAFNRTESTVLLHLLNYLWDISRPYLSTEMVDSNRSHQDHLRQLKIYESGTIDELLAATEDHRSFRLNVIEAWERRLELQP